MIRLFDAHADTPYELWTRGESLTKNTRHIDLEKCAVFSEYRQIFAFCSLAGSKYAISEDDFSRCYRAFRTQTDRQATIHPYFSVEGPEIIGFDADRLREYSVTMCTLTWNADNVLAGCHTGDNGLSARGRDFVRRAQQYGVTIDVSHLSERAFWDLVRITKVPICASHSNCRALWEHTRNLTDDQLRAVADCKGVVGLNFYTGFLGEGADFETLRRHLEHMLALCGEKHVCLGGDLDGCDSLPVGISHIGHYADFYRYLLDAGYDEKLLDKIYYSNLLCLVGEGL